MSRSRRRSVAGCLLCLLYLGLVVLGALSSFEAAADPCLQVTQGGTTIGTCEPHGGSTHVCDTTGDGTEVTYCIGPLP